MEDINQVLKQVDMTSVDGMGVPTASGNSTTCQKTKGPILRVIAFVIGQKMLMRLRRKKYFASLLKAERECSLNMQDKIIFLTKAITVCHEAFGFAPRSLEKKLLQNVRQMNLTIGSLNKMAYNQ